MQAEDRSARQGYYIHAAGPPLFSTLVAFRRWPAACSDWVRCAISPGGARLGRSRAAARRVPAQPAGAPRRAAGGLPDGRPARRRRGGKQSGRGPGRVRRGAAVHRVRRVVVRLRDPGPLECPRRGSGACCGDQVAPGPVRRPRWSSRRRWPSRSGRCSSGSCGPGTRPWAAPRGLGNGRKGRSCSRSASTPANTGGWSDCRAAWAAGWGGPHSRAPWPPSCCSRFLTLGGIGGGCR